MSKIIYIRHGNDTVEHHAHDEILTDDGKRGAEQLAEKLLLEYGTPDIIFYSPFYRTRQTLAKMLKIIKYNKNKKVKTICDNRLSRYFTSKEKRHPDIRDDTAELGAPTDETWKEFKKRVKSQIKDMKKKRDRYRVIWCITHTLVLDYLIKKKTPEHGYKISYLDTIVI